MTTRAVLRSLVVLIFVLCTGDAVAQTLPKDPCALLKPAEIQALAPNAKIGSGVPSTQPPLGVSCQYAWGPRNPAWGETTLSISVVDASKVYPGGPQRQ